MVHNSATISNFNTTIPKPIPHTNRYFTQPPFRRLPSQLFQFHAAVTGCAFNDSDRECLDADKSLGLNYQKLCPNMNETRKYKPPIQITVTATVKPLYILVSRTKKIIITYIITILMIPSKPVFKGIQNFEYDQEGKFILDTGAHPTHAPTTGKHMKNVTHTRHSITTTNSPTTITHTGILITSTSNCYISTQAIMTHEITNTFFSVQ